jgi:hypothetical protein
MRKDKEEKKLSRMHLISVPLQPQDNRPILNAAASYRSKDLRGEKAK